MKRQIPLLIAIVCGFVMIISYFIPATESWGEDVGVWFTILQGAAFVLGAGSLLSIHLKKISSQRKGWGYSVIMLAAFFATLAVGLGKIGVNPPVAFPDKPMAGNYRELGGPFWWLFEYAFKPLTATMFAMLAFYVASAAFRAFRAKNIEAILLLGTAFIILLGRTAAGVFLTSFVPEAGADPTFIQEGIAMLRLENLTVEIMSVFNTAGNRAIMIGIALGTASVALKILLGIDRSYIGSGDD